MLCTYVFYITTQFLKVFSCKPVFCLCPVTIGLSLACLNRKLATFIIIQPRLCLTNHCCDHWFIARLRTSARTKPVDFCAFESILWTFCVLGALSRDIAVTVDGSLVNSDVITRLCRYNRCSRIELSTFAKSINVVGLEFRQDFEHLTIDYKDKYV